MIVLSILFFIFAVATMKYKQKVSKRAFLDATLFFLFGILNIAYFVANYFTGAGINETVLAALNLGLEDAGFEEYIYLIAISIFAFVIIFIAAFFYYTHLKSVTIANPKKIKAFLHNSFFILAFMVHPATKDLKNLYQNLTLEQSKDYYEYYKIPTEFNSTANKKNLIIIYAESLERTYLNTDLFPNLTPNLNHLIKKYNATEFTNITQVAGSDYTIAGMTSTQCAMPLFTNSGGNSMDGVDKFYPKALCIGDILKKEDYFLSFIQGSSTSFSGIKKFYTTHSFDKIQGKEELQKRLKNKRYLNGWGLYDDSLLGFAYEEFESLTKANKPFALFLHTIDTHHPKGHLSSSCKKDLYNEGSNDILNCVKCSDTLISDFITKILESKYAKDTIVVVTSDHLAMRNTATKYLEKSDARRDLFVVFDRTKSEYNAVSKIGTPFDFSPTVLSFLGIDIDLGLGRNLMQKESIYTLFENFDRKLNGWRNEILTFWEFPKMSNELKLDLKNKKLYIGENNYKLPILLKIFESSIEPYFEYENSWKLYEQLEHFKPNDKFLWVGRCDIINYIFDENKRDKQCMAQGIFGQKYKILGIDKSGNYSIENFDDTTLNNTTQISNIMAKIDMLKKNGVRYDAKLQEGMSFKKEGYASFLENIEGVSYHEEFGRWSDADLNKTVTLTFKENLPKKFKFEITAQAHEQSPDKKVTLQIGSKQVEFIASAKKPQKYTFDFENIIDEKIIKITPPSPYVPTEEMEGSDIRKKGLLIIDMKIITPPTK